MVTLCDQQLFFFAGQMYLGRIVDPSTKGFLPPCG
ncbi:unnamed protein product [Ixodes persulcatus]